jgi:hypothetical protein
MYKTVKNYCIIYYIVQSTFFDVHKFECLFVASLMRTPRESRNFSSR